jgi:dihydrofolate reductase
MTACISIIAAVADNNVIGNDNSLIWRLPADLKRFKQLTMGHAIIMGRKTYQSIGKPLPGRQNIVISRSNQSIEGCALVHSLEEALNICQNDPEVFIIGGGQIYQQSIAIANKLYITHLHQKFDGDTFFPEIKQQIWRVESESDFLPDEKNAYSYSFVNYIQNHE